MARAFRIQRLEEADTLILRVSGDLDGSSACELTQHLERSGSRFPKIIIDAHRLGSVHPFGRAVIEKSMERCRSQGRHLDLQGGRGFFPA